MQLQSKTESYISGKGKVLSASFYKPFAKSMASLLRIVGL